MSRSTVGIVVFAFGSPASIEPNILLREIAIRFAKLHSAPLILTQGEIPFISAPGIENISEGSNAEPTLRIARWAVKRAIEKGLSKLVIVAARPHIGRCLRDIRWAITEQKAGIWAEACPGIPYPNRMWYDPGSNQPRSRSPLAWWPRELLLRCMPMWLYAKIAG